MHFEKDVILAVSNGVVESQGCKSLLAAKLQLKQRQKWFELGEDKQEILW